MKDLEKKKTGKSFRKSFEVLKKSTRNFEVLKNILHKIKKKKVLKSFKKLIRNFEVLKKIFFTKFVLISSQN